MIASHSPSRWANIACHFCGPLALLLVGAVSLFVAIVPAELTRSTIHLALLEYAAALWLMSTMTDLDWRSESLRGRWGRQMWTWGCLTLHVHVACAFHFTHRWSQAHAFEQTRLEGGFGEGLYVNYLFMAAWVADVLW